MPASIIYNSSTLASLENSSVTLLTAGKQLTDNVVVTDMFSGNTIDDVVMGIITSGSISGNASYIASYAFTYTGITRADFPNVTSIGTAAFMSCFSLSEINFPACTALDGGGAFQDCKALISVDFPSVTNIGSNMFQRCSALTSVSFPNATSIYAYAFTGCSALTTVSFPKCTFVSGYAFQTCTNLTEVRLPKCSVFNGGYIFFNCYNLISLYMNEVTAVPSLIYSTIFDSTPIGGYSESAGTLGNIYVPTSLVASFKAASYWSLFSSRFIGV